MTEGKMSERLWEIGWEGHEKAQLLRMSRLPFVEKIKWLEEAQKLIHKLGCQRNSNKAKESKAGP